MQKLLEYNNIEINKGYEDFESTLSSHVSLCYSIEI